MANPLSSCFAQIYLLAATGYAWSVTDLFSTRTVTINPGSAARYFRTYLALASGGGTNAGTVASPDELLAHISTQLNAGTSATRWSLTMNAIGIVSFNYSGASTATIAFTTTQIRDLLGFTGNISIVGPGSQTASYQPTHMAFFSSRPGPNVWQPIPAKIVGAEMPNGDVYSWRSSSCRMRRTFDLGLLARDIAMRGTIGDLSMDTPIYPAKSRWAAPSAALGTAPPWSVYELMRTSDGTRLGAAFGNFQAMAAGSDLLFDEVYWTLDTVRAMDQVSLVTPNLGTLYNWRNVSCFWKAQGTR